MPAAGDRRRFSVLAGVILLAAAWLYGHFAYDPSVERYLELGFTEAVRYERLSHDAGRRLSLFEAFDDQGRLIGYVTLAEGRGYGGPMLVVVGWSEEGSLLTLRVAKHREDAAWFRLLEDRGFFEQYLGRKDSDPLELTRDIDAVSGATLSSYGVAEGVQRARVLVADQLGHEIPPRLKTAFRFGLPEVLFIIAFGWVVLLRTSRYLSRTKWRRVPSLAVGFVVLGIWVGQPLSLVNFTTWLVGYSPPIQTNIILYGMIFGVVGGAIMLGKNFYCFWICPFSAVQEGAHLLTGVKIRPDESLRKKLRWVRFFLLWTALVAVFLLRAPSAAIFEPWTALFTLKGTTFQWVLVAITLFGAMLVHNFWCIYSCPVGLVLETVVKIRQWVKGLWKKRSK